MLNEIRTPKRRALPSHLRLSSGAMEFLRHGLLIFLATTVANAANYVFNALVSRRLGVEQYGEFSSLIAILMIGSIPATIATTIIVKLAAQYHASDGQHGVAVLTRRAVRVLVPIAVSFTIVLCLAARQIAQFLHVRDAVSVALSVIAIGIAFVLPAGRGSLQGGQSFQNYSWSLLIETVGKLVLGIGMVYLGLGIRGALSSIIIASAISAIFSYSAAARSGAGSSVEAPLHINISRVFVTVGGVAAASVALTLLGFSDVIFVKHYFTDEQTGLYAASSLIGKVLLFGVAFLPALILPKSAAAISTGRASRRLLVPPIVIIILVALAGLTLVDLFPQLALHIVAGTAYRGASSLVFPYAAASTMLAVTNVLVAFNLGSHRLRFVMPLLLIAVGEIFAFTIWHHSLSEILRSVVLGQSTAMLVSALFAFLPHRHDLVTETKTEIAA